MDGTAAKFSSQAHDEAGVTESLSDRRQRTLSATLLSQVNATLPTLYNRAPILTNDAHGKGAPRNSDYKNRMTTTKLTGDEVRLRLYEQFARIGKAVSHPRRLELVELLAQGERSVEILANAANLTVANTSQHLQQLRSAGLVTSRKEGLRVYYRLANDSVGEMLEVMQRLADTTLAEVDRIVSAYRSLQEQMEPIGAAELLARLKDGKVTLLDVRPHEEYEAGHVPGAINIPLAELESRIHELDPKCEVVAYCRGYFCLLADDAVTRLRRNGLNARRLSSGFPKWKRSGMPVDTSTRKH